MKKLRDLSTVTNTSNLPELFHLSFNQKLQGVWKPKRPDGNYDTPTNVRYREPNFPRVSCAPTLKQCFWAIYPNISHFFEMFRYPYIVMAVYSPVMTEDVKVISNEVIVKERLVHDAHMTGEYFIISPVRMNIIKKVKIKNPVKNEEIRYHPFNDPKEEEVFLSYNPEIVDAA